MSTLRTNAITDVAGTGAPNFPNGIRIPATNALPDPENRIINGAFDFWQRGTSFSAGQYGADRWTNDGLGGTVTQSRQGFNLGETLGSNNPTYFLRQTVSGQTLASSLAFNGQRIESVKSYAGQTITVLGWVRRSSGSGNMAVFFTQNFGTGGTPSTAVDSGGQTVTLSGVWAPFAVILAVPSITGKTLGTAGNDYLQVNFMTSAGSNYNAISNSLGLQTIGVDLWGIHIKLGTHTTDAVNFYKAPELGTELARCQRYLQLFNCVAGAAFSPGSSGAIAASTVNFATEMRATPAITAGTLINNSNTSADAFTNVSPTGLTYTVIIGGAAGNFTRALGSNRADAEV